MTRYENRKKSQFHLKCENQKKFHIHCVFIENQNIYTTETYTILIYVILQGPKNHEQKYHIVLRALEQSSLE